MTVASWPMEPEQNAAPAVVPLRRTVARGDAEQDA